MRIAQFAGVALGAAMAAFGVLMPPVGGVPTPTFESGVERDGYGRKIRPPRHPNHNAKRRSEAWRDYAAKVRSTHRDLPNGTRQEDPRDDKYLHSSARSRRSLRRAISRAA